ncbi:hypothetical protein ANAPRD1_01265 [Anaplasma phagocytophilum]|nr:hypothetical protein ANAPC5_01492 [Anaplasma phagocytophilum]SCV66748.1 hypothetical protein ANAPRD1_01265 [Anaplasma phagocytophilum]
MLVGVCEWHHHEPLAQHGFRPPACLAVLGVLVSDETGVLAVERSPG